MKIVISKDFSETPGARYKNEGDHSGEEFRETILVPKFEQAIKQGEKLLVDLDGGYGYPTSFLEESFGGLARIYDYKKIMSILEFKSDDEPSLIEDIKGYMKSAKSEDNKWEKNVYIVSAL